MKRFNFNQLNNVKTPDDWVEKALNIPNTATETKGKIIPFLGKTKYIATAASVVLCCALGVFLFSSFDKDGYIVPMPSKENTNNEESSATTPKGENASENIFGNENRKNTQNNTFPNNYFGNGNSNIFTGGNGFRTPSIIPYPTENGTVNQNITTPQGGNGTAVTIPDIQEETTAEVTQGYVDNNNSQTVNTSQNISYPYVTQSPTKATELVPPATGLSYSTDVLIASSSNITKPTQKEPSRPNASSFTLSSASYTQPTLLPNATGGDMHTPGNPPEGTAVGSATVYFNRVIRFFPGKNTRFNINGSISCHIESISGETYSEKYSSAEVCSHFSGGVEFFPSKKIGSLKCGTYKVTFYDYFGNSITETCWLMDMDCYVYE